MRPFPGVLKQVRSRKCCLGLEISHSPPSPCFSPPRVCTELAHTGLCPESASLAWALGSNRVELVPPGLCQGVLLYWVWCLGGGWASYPWNEECCEGRTAAQELTPRQTPPGEGAMCRRRRGSTFSGLEPQGFSFRISTRRKRCFSPPKQQSSELGEGSASPRNLAHNDSAPSGRSYLTATQLGGTQASTISPGGSVLVQSPLPCPQVRPPSLWPALHLSHSP